jgi:uncharacterized protein
MSEFQPAPPPPPSSASQPLAPADEKLWSTLAHVGNIIGFLPSLLILLILGPRSERVKTEAKEALNFVITAMAVWIVLAIVGGILFGIYIATPSSGLDVVLSLLRGLISLLQFADWIVLIIFSIVAAVRVNNGGTYRYPFALRLIK